VVTIRQDLAVKNIVIPYGDILNICKCQIQELGRAETVHSINKEDFLAALIVREIIGKEEELDEVLQQRHTNFRF
jgi:hypothetical protein